MKKILVTGAGGYIGSVLVEKLLKNNYSVRAVDRFFFGSENLIQNENLEIVQDDTRNLANKYFNDIFAVIDLAAISNDPSAEMFAKETTQINYQARFSTAQNAKKNSVTRYILPSSASVYGFNSELMKEDSPVNPLTVYAESNLNAEKVILPLASDDFIVTVIRQATVYGYSPRMRFDLAVNGMTYGAWKNGILPLMRDGSQLRPMVHIEDTTDLMIFLLGSEVDKINGEIFNVGSNDHNFRIDQLAESISKIVTERTGNQIKIEWYGDPDHRSYQLDFTKVTSVLGWTASHSLESGVLRIIDALEKNQIDKTSKTMTLEWYRQLEYWHKVIKEVEKYGGILDIDK